MESTHCIHDVVLSYIIRYDQWHPNTGGDSDTIFLSWLLKWGKSESLLYIALISASVADEITDSGLPRFIRAAGSRF